MKNKYLKIMMEMSSTGGQCICVYLEGIKSITGQLNQNNMNKTNGAISNEDIAAGIFSFS